ncbi:hypothetical protein BC834DRAFT_859169 [Gloeopeniophorella convolvens]|nr:hypothetical protein BC834DRAFT_859169 [Gloeopeniophorella convolvens]
MLHFAMDTTQTRPYPILFALAVAFAAGELGLTAFLLAGGGTGPWYDVLLILLLFDAIWTVLFSSTYVLWSTHGGLHLLADLTSSIFWIFAAAFCWGLVAGFAQSSKAEGCARHPSSFRCSRRLSIGSLAWIEFALCAMTLALAAMWVRASRKNRRPNICV